MAQTNSLRYEIRVNNASVKQLAQVVNSGIDYNQLNKANSEIKYEFSNTL